MSTWQPDDRYLSLLRLDKGCHEEADLAQDPEYTACLLEAVSFVAGEPWSDRPACVSPVLVEFGRELNDVLSDGKRQQLTPLIPALIGTAGDGQDVTRSFLALDWLIRVFTPAFLRLVPDLVDDADRLAGLPPIMDEPAARAANLMVQTARTRTAATWKAVGDAAMYATWKAVGDAAMYAAWKAVGDAAMYAAWKAAWKAAGYAAWKAVGDAARGAAGYDAWKAARGAVGDAAGYAAGQAAYQAARGAAWEHLQPTVDALQDSAITLFTRMINPGVS